MAAVNRLSLQRLRLRTLPPLPGGLRLWVSLLSFGFLLAALVSHGGQLLQQRLDPRGWLWLLLGVGVSLLSLVANGAAWGVVLRQLGLRPRWPELITAYLATNLRKYLPGGIWHLTSRVARLQDPDGPLAQPVAGAQALAAVVLDPLLMAVAALTLVPFGGLQGGLGLVSPLAVLLLRPRWLQPLLQRLIAGKQRLLEDPASEGSVQAPVDWPWKPLLLELLFLGFRFAGFACCLLSFSAAVPPGWGPWLGGFALAWTAGLLVPGAPGGLGVFELVLLARLRGAVPTAELLAVLVSYRLISVLAEGLAAAAVLLDDRLAAARNNR